MAAAESINVPSQSNTSRSKREPMVLTRFLGVERRNEGLQFLGQRRFERETRSRLRMRDNRLRRVQEHALQSLAGEVLVERKVAVLVIAGDRKAQMGEMDPYLMCPAGLQLGFEEAVILPSPLQAKHGVRGRPFPAYTHPALAGLQKVLVEGQLDVALRIAPSSLNQSEV